MRNDRQAPSQRGNPTRRRWFETLEQRTLLSAGGLAAQYFHNEGFTGLAYESVEAVDFDWGTGSPAPGVAPSTFSVRWTGQVRAAYSEDYTFYATSDQGVRLWVDGRLLIDHWDPHNTTVDSATVSLVSGRRYDIRVDYYEQYGSAEVQLEWSSSSLPREVVPASQLYTSPAGLFGSYADGAGGAASRYDANIDFDWGAASAHPAVAADGFQVEWTGQVRPDHSGAYTFSVTSDEGVRLWVDGELVVDDWQPHTTRTATGVKQLEAGKWYDVRITYYDQSGAAGVSLSWSGEGQTGNQTQVIRTENLRAAKPTELTFQNPLGPGQDPYVTQWNNSYLHVRSAGRSVLIDQADALVDIHPSNAASSTVVAWTAPLGTSYSQQVWAPEIFHHNGKWYLYFTASDGDNANHRMYVLERDDPDPMGPYVFRGQIAAATDRWAIDGTVLDWQGQLYFIWSGWPGATNGQQNLYIAEMSDPLTISGDRHLISTPDYAWERQGLAINEGPQILAHQGELHIIYSGSGYWRHEYALGRLTYDGVGSLLERSSWQKSPSPVFSQAGAIVGTGHASFTTSLDGSEHWMVYHAHHDPANFQEDRDILLQEFAFDAAGNPDFGEPVPTSTPQSVPGGLPDPERPLLVGDFDGSGLVDRSDYAVWRGSYGLVVAPGVGADANRNGVIDAGDYALWRDNRGAVPPGQDPTLAYWRHEEGPAGQPVIAGEVSVVDSSGSGNPMQTIEASSTAASYSTDVSPLALRSGLPNTLSLDFGPGGDGPGRNDGNVSSGSPINTHTFEALTVEFAFRLKALGGFQTLVGKDGAPVSSPVAPLQVKVRGDNFPGGEPNQLFVEWIDGDGDSAQLLIAGETGDYTIVDAMYGADFRGPSGEVLYSTNSAFSVGRGAYNGNAADWVNALIDEVRISDEALDLSQLLFVPSVVPAAALAAPAPPVAASDNRQDLTVWMPSETLAIAPASEAMASHPPIPQGRPTNLLLAPSARVQRASETDNPQEGRGHWSPEEADSAKPPEDGLARRVRDAAFASVLAW
ncbi:Extracellular exo-alpha-(1-_5)-L-arabinofuranosidase precursor [Posidoniimonas polymericola]|uniref:Extracellular exo-alpha-(1->5)-L-arabinofuranosidase n=1 Tax=Posidoniimonas polymericola TaxID=2528002 RepID=A0A5C5YUC0_9BACT|nr:PA14 domain-containing protein [Posidoniimonas polymericola]TWT78376.1 Extracellular exo-alpha-(1->5)-L-arabinofuranosidase precursor [Posidoniimonas polymericola]